MSRNRFQSINQNLEFIGRNRETQAKSMKDYHKIYCAVPDSNFEDVIFELTSSLVDAGLKALSEVGHDS